MKTTTPTITETRTWSASRVRQACIKHDFYTCGDDDDYSAMLDQVRDLRPTTANIYLIAKDIFDHSDTEEKWEDLTVEYVMYVLSNEAVITTYTIKGG